MNTLPCLNEKRRGDVRKSPVLAGIDYLEISDGPLEEVREGRFPRARDFRPIVGEAQSPEVKKEEQPVLRVYFLGKVPSTPLKPENFRVEGGRRVRDIRVLDVFTKQFHDPELDDYAEVVLDRFGDFSTYTLRVVARAAGNGVTRWVAHPEFDPVYNQIDFTFAAGCPTELDCPKEEVCPPPERIQPALNYLAKDYASFRQLIFDRLAVVMPEWKNRYVPDLGVTLVELLAYTGDYLSYYQDAVATEAYLDTARQRISVRRHARLVDYAVHEGCNARAFVVVESNSEMEIKPGEVQFITSPGEGLTASLKAEALSHLNLDRYEVFEAIAPVKIWPGHERIEIYTWGNSECCLPREATKATLADRWIGNGKNRTRKLKLRPGDFMIFEEVTGLGTGSAADSDPAHRCAVRLTAVTEDVDPLNETPVLNIEWAQEDALPFALCLSAVGPPPECALLTNISVARGNVVLVDHGKTVEEDLPPVPVRESAPACEGENAAAEVTHSSALFRPRLAHPEVTFREALPPAASAKRILAQDPHKAVPVVTLDAGKWTAVSDLIESRSTDTHFVVEVDNERRANLRFGDGTHGAVPPPLARLHARYRTGGGKAGNVGAEAISHVLWPANTNDAISSVRNPLAAQGGTEPESLQDVKLFAPQCFRKNLQRAVTAGDYAAIAKREFPAELQSAAAALRWNGSWYEALVAADALGTEQAPQDLLHRVWRRLINYRRIGHDLRVEGPVRVPVLISILVCVNAVYLRAQVLADLQAAFGTAMLPDGSLGFFHPDNLTFGGALYVSQVVSRAQSIPGVEGVKVLRFERMFQGPHHEIRRGFISFGPFEIAQCASDPSFPENGRIEFKIGGGR